MLETYLSLLDEAYFEVGEAFKGLKDEHVWKRPAEGLLSIGELAGHVAYWETLKFATEPAGWKPDLANCKVNSPLIDHHFRYYTETVAKPLPEQLLSLTAEEVGNELQRVHKEVFAYFTAQNPDIDTPLPAFSPKATYRKFLSYAVFHVSYHVGQMYTVLHLLGEETPDN